MVTLEEVEARYRAALAELDRVNEVYGGLSDQVVGYQVAVARCHLGFEAVRAHLWAAELGLRLVADQRERQVGHGAG